MSLVSFPRFIELCAIVCDVKLFFFLVTIKLIVPLFFFLNLRSFYFLPDELLSSQEKSCGMKDVIVSIDTSKDSDAESSKPSSKATSLQNSPAIQKGQLSSASVCLRSSFPVSNFIYQAEFRVSCCWL